ncbi:MAG: Fe(3+) ions import ATP-binding protein FbpC 2 [Alphaproteobacteria bacterium MarineAlpha2_Bin1]|nr:MAG: Fe(3+) ions import ATP-binding protein FbpC 2 [Alphaproteobacteria bacterium MarineAlpha2_Bin1]|tara:strand:- start:316 stop:1401 length:1086 start_codon:yes stop_codon:yes gene_type:complete
MVMLMSKNILPTLYINNISHKYGKNEIINDLSFEVFSNEIVCLLGPSGSGKSTILRLIAGLENLQYGKINLNNKIISSDNSDYIQPEDREIGFVFQDLALFPHLNVESNINYGLNKIKKNIKKDVYNNLINKIGIKHLEKKYPHELSGGEQQRVALARALAPKPKLMLLDEPFSDLDSRLRDIIRDETISILKSNGTPVLLVTHDPNEAMLVSDKIIIINNKNKIQEGSSEDLYFKPKNKFVAGFFSDINIFDGVVNESKVNFLLGAIHNDNDFGQKEVEVVIRTEGIKINNKKTENYFNIEGEISSLKKVGIFQYVNIAVKGYPKLISARLTDSHNISKNSMVWLGFDPRFTFIFEKEKH